MKQLSLNLFISLAFILLFNACKTSIVGDVLQNELPNTHTSIDTIIRNGENRLESEVTLNWWGDDADGYITGYAYTFDEIINETTIWHFIDMQDSTFILSTPPGQDTANYYFSIKAIDNDGAFDNTPARLVIPVKNSPPSIVFLEGINNPTKSFPVLKYFWNATDADGEENLKEIELYFNDTTTAPYILDKTTSSAIFEAQNPTEDNFICNVYPNAATTPNIAMLNGLIGDAWNTLYIRAVDQSNAKSTFVKADSVYIKKVKSNILLVNGYTSSTNEDFYASHLINNGINTFDTIQIFETVASHYTQQSADNITQGMVFNLFDVLIWFSNDADNSFSLAQKTTDKFFNSNGKMFMSVYISSSFDPLSNFLDFTPIESLVDVVDTTLLLYASANLNPTIIDYPILQSSSIIGIVKPINLQIGASPLYSAALTAKDNITLSLSPYTGNSTVIAKKENVSGATNFVISTLELQKLDGLLNMDDFFQKVFIDEFGL